MKLKQIRVMKGRKMLTGRKGNKQGQESSASELIIDTNTH